MVYLVAGDFTRTGIFCSFYYPREKWGTSQSRPVKQTNQRTNQSSNYACTCRRIGAKREKNARQCHSLAYFWLVEVASQLAHSIENCYTERRYIRHLLPTTSTFKPLCHRLIPLGEGGGVELETGICIVELRFIILALLACVHSLMQLKIHRFPILHNWLPERAGVNPVFWLATDRVRRALHFSGSHYRRLFCQLLTWTSYGKSVNSAGKSALKLAGLPS